MPTSTVQRDPAHPDFPHGTSRGNHRGCHCQPCAEAGRRQRKRRAYNRHVAGPAYPAVTEDFRNHVRSLLSAVPTTSRDSLAAAAGIGRTTAGLVMRAAHGQEMVLHRNVIDAVLAVTPAALTPHVRRVPAGPYLERLNRMRANGWPIDTVCARAGVPHLRDILNRGKTTILTEHAAALDKVFTEIGSAAPTDAEVPPNMAARSRTLARRAGYFPPAAYDDDGTVDPRAVPGSPFEAVDVAIARRVDVLRLKLAGSTHLEAAEQAGVSDRCVERVLVDAGRPMEAAAREVWAARCRTVIETAQTEGTDPVLVALELGLVSIKRLPLDHPVRRKVAAAVPAPEEPGDLFACAGLVLDATAAA